MTAVELLPVLARASALGALVLVAGGFAFLALVARPAARDPGGDGAAVADLERLVPRVARGALAMLVAAMGLDLWLRAAAAAGGGLAAGLALPTLATFVTATWYGRVWLARLALAGLLAVALAYPPATRRLGAARLPLAVLLLGFQPLAGHPAAGERAALVAWQVTADLFHVLAAGAWAGGLPFLAVVLARRRDPASAFVLAALLRRFSTLGLVAVCILVLSGAANAWALVGSVPALLGTPYGRLLLAKLGLLLPLLGLAAWNRFRGRPRLGGPQVSLALRRLARTVAGETALGGAILALTGWLASTQPARHAEPAWPFDFRLTGAFLDAVPGVESRLLVAGSVASFGVLALFAAALFPERRRSAVLAGLLGLALGALLVRPLWPFLAIDAYPTTYARPAARYDVVSVANGLALYRQHCAGCHGPSGRGDGPTAAALPVRPADLTGAHAREHTAGDLFWWIARGIAPAMPGFADRLDAEARWDLVNTIRALADSDSARALGPTPAARRLVAPDLAYTTTSGEVGTLRDFRGRNVVLLVLFSLPGSHERLRELSDAYERLRHAGAEVLAIPLEVDHVGSHAPPPPPVAFPTVADGASEAAATLTLFHRGSGIPRHMELLVDRQGYVRASLTLVDRHAGVDIARLADAVERLAAEPARAPAPGEHVH